MRTRPRFRPRLKLKKRGPVQTPFNEAVTEAVRVTKKLNSLNQVNSHRMSADALLRETLAILGTSPARIAKLRRTVESSKPGFDHSKATLRRMITFLRGPNWAGPPRDPQRLRFLSTDACEGELARVRSSSAEAFCVAIQVAGELHPEAFGTVEDSGKLDEDLSELRERQRHLFHKIATSFSPADLETDARDEQGRPTVAFKLGAGRVPIAPVDSAGERLTNYLIANRAS